MFPINSTSNVLKDSKIVEFYENLNSENRIIIEQIDSFNDLEDLELLNADSFVERTILLSKLVGSKPLKVWGEYYYVNQNVTIPELFNKATSIPLTKNEVINLIDDLTKTYLSTLLKVGGSQRIVSQNNKVPLRFTDETGAHFSPRYTEIKFYNYGDWRFGYHGVFSAETIFHEFSHLLDASRHHKTNIDSHDDKFVKILESVLLRYKDWIEQRYNRNNLINQIILNSELMKLWSESKDFFINQELLKKKSETEAIAQIRKQKAQDLGFKDDEIPMGYLVEQENEILIDYFIKALTKYKDLGKDIPLVNKTRKNILDNDINSVFTKEQVRVIQKAIEFSDVESIIEVGMLEQNRLQKMVDSANSKIQNILSGFSNMTNSGRIITQ
jgi:hypothetical protein